MNEADEIKKDFEENVDHFDGNPIDKGLQGAIIGCLDKACGGKENRHLVLKQLTGHASSKDLHSAYWYALYRLTLPWKPEGGRWCSGKGEGDLEDMCQALLRASVDQPGQTKMFEYPEFSEMESQHEPDQEIPF